MDWKIYEETVKSIYEALGKEQGVKIICYGNSCKCTGKSGVIHQVDVITSHDVGLHTYKTAIECKYWDEKINKDIVMKLIQIRDDCNFDKAIVVSKLGFTEDGLKYAEYNNIGLVELREPLAQDLQNRIKRININLQVLLPEIIYFNNISYEEIRLEIKIDDGYYLMPDGSQIAIRGLINDFFKEIEQKQIFDNPVSKQLSFSHPTYLKVHNTQMQFLVKSLEMQGIIRTHTELLEIKEDYIWLIMKSIFEKKIIFIQPDGKMREVPYE